MSDHPREHNCLSYWFPRIQAAGLPVPATRIVTTDVDLSPLVDGYEPRGNSGAFFDALFAAVHEIGLPCFLRTGYGSGKHDWQRTCYLSDITRLGSHVAHLVEWSHMVDIIGLPTNVWAVRELVPTVPLFHAFSGRMPITREFRFGVRDGEVCHIQPYWPPSSIQHPDQGDWHDWLRIASILDERTAHHLSALALRACAAVDGGYWSIDFLEASSGRWYLTDMARGDDSFWWDPETDVGQLGAVDQSALAEALVVDGDR